MLFSESTIAVLLAMFAHLSLAVAEIAEASVKVTGGGSRGFSGGKQDFDPRGLFCNVDSANSDTAEHPSQSIQTAPIQGAHSAGAPMSCSAGKSDRIPTYISLCQPLRCQRLSSKLWELHAVQEGFERCEGSEFGGGAV
ncbi:hypothetical protein MGG_17022 [Pyricularia oryzae 70-15]|uniref:Uncharacterized protein n=1 Tax=Pyricularia oryzae (strain 70-15 / ATCC MYA-4617 / FGSC 8958) TaxID=242507 RepID=G4NAM3_PYRO7|nr:uncharacterized protein MGG_17022 [Pyricularia oryzae 70-15]EHA49666.1 hypothetical protein MGG_17022 [Pyricularia oryzae 70-15]